MRELKFRVWSEEDREYRTDCNVFRLFHGKTGCPATIYNDEGDRFDIEQYTGLKDKNGKEIYEGDIVEYSWDFCGEKHKNNYVVEWLSGKVEHYPYSVDSGFTLPDSVEGYYVVIGNIHENPELIEKEK